MCYSVKPQNEQRRVHQSIATTSRHILVLKSDRIHNDSSIDIIFQEYPEQEVTKESNPKNELTVFMKEIQKLRDNF